MALQPVDLCRIPTSVVTRLQTETLRLHQRLMEKWYKALSVANDYFLTELATGHACQRLARLLIWLSEDAHAISREDLGALLGVTLETTSWTISKFRRSGVPTTLSHNLVRCDRAALAEIAV